MIRFRITSYMPTDPTAFYCFKQAGPFHASAVRQVSSSRTVEPRSLQHSMILPSTVR